MINEISAPSSRHRKLSKRLTVRYVKKVHGLYDVQDDKK